MKPRKVMGFSQSHTAGQPGLNSSLLTAEFNCHAPFLSVAASLNEPEKWHSLWKDITVSFITLSKIFSFV